MFNELKGKRLLILGGSLWKETIKQFADTYGITLIATGNDSSAGIFEIADECYNINSTDKEAMKNLIRQKNIDGVYMGGSEAVISSACEYLNELGMPCYCTKQQWEYLQNKSNLKDLYMKFGLPVAKRYDIDKEIDDKDFPVIVKPVDGSGSNGFAVCNNMDELKEGYETAIRFSPSGNALIEKFIPNEGIVVLYRMCAGKLNFCCIEDKYPVHYKDLGRYVAGMHVFESKHTERFRKLYESKIEQMLTSIGITEGPLWFEVFMDGEEFCFNEVGYRYSGSVTIWPVQYIAGVNEVASDIYYALTGKSQVKDFISIIPENFPTKKYYCIYSIHLKSGKICSVEGLSDLLAMDNVVSIPVTKNIGTTVAHTGTVGQVFAFVHFVCQDKNELKDMIGTIHDTLKIYDEQGNNLVNKMIDTSRIDARI